jgi:glyoxylase-like metal-dependent hydrolase (beta-lactamase superfamily II)
MSNPPATGLLREIARILPRMRETRGHASRRWVLLVATLAAGHAIWPARAAVQSKPTPPKAVRLYVFDCGMLTATTEGVERYHVTPAEVGETRMPVPCFLVAHPRGTLMWDVGVIPDSVVEAQPQGARSNVNPTVSALVTRTLKSQLAQVGYSPADITYVAVSHAHIDHTANLNAFAGSTWLTRPAEREFMWTENNARVNPPFYTALKGSKVVTLDKDEHDVFGDGQVVMKAAPGHTPGHQVLILRLASTGRVMLSGDLYHYPQERTLHRAPPDNEFSVEQSNASRVRLEEYLKTTRTELWIEHDFNANAKLKKAPAFYD